MISVHYLGKCRARGSDQFLTATMFPMIFHRFTMSRFFVIALCSLFAAFLPLRAQPGYDDFPVERFTAEQGYNGATPNCFLQDKKGVMWIGTDNGLYRYDGTFRLYAQQANNPFALSHSNVRTLCEDKEGRLWVGTSGGLHRFDQAGERFTRYGHSDGDSASLSMDDINYILEDADGRLWVITENGKLHRFDKNSGKVLRVYPIRWYFQIVLDGSGRLLLKQANDVFRYDEKSDAFIRLPIDLSPESYPFMNSGSDTLWFGARIKNNYFLYAVNVRTGAIAGPLVTDTLGSRSVVSASPERIWIRGWHNLYKFNLLTGRVQKCKPILIPAPLEAVRPISGGPGPIYEDRSGVLWFVSPQWGLVRYSPYKRRFKLYRHHPLDTNSLSGNYARGLLKDKDDNLWVGIQTGGLNKIDRKTGRVTRYRADKRKANTLANDDIWALHQESNGLILVGSNVDNGALQIFDPKHPERGFRPFPNFFAGDEREAYHGILSISPDRGGNLWIGTAWIPFRKISRDRRNVIPFTVRTSKGEQTDLVHSVCEDRLGTLWVGDLHGLFRYDTATKSLYHYTSTRSNPLTIGDNFITHIMETRAGDVWVATKGGGIAKYDRRRDVFTRVTIDNGLPHDNCYAILEDGRGLLWISTDNGVCSYNPQTGAIHRYDADDGLQGKEFNRCSFVKGNNGEMFFGGTEGVNSFFPDLFQDNPTPPLAAIMSVRDIGGDTAYSVAYREELDLTHGQNNISIEAAALEFTFPERNMYSWRLEDVDTGWTEAKRERWITYTNLSPGEYRVRVKVANADGVWNTEPAMLLIRIHPAWWQTWWFRSFAALAAVVALGAMRQMYRRRIARLQEQQKMLLEQRAELIMNIEERRRSEQKFRALFDTSPLGMILWERSGQIIETNPAFEAITGYGAQDAASLDFRSLVSDSLFALIDYGLERRGAFGPIEHIFIRADGAKLSILLSGIVIGEAVVPPTNADDNRIWSVMEDITERKRATDAMLRHQLNPHFMFNVLNSISSLLSENPRNAKRMILEFSLLLRHTLDAGSQLTISLGEEIEAVEHYLDIEKLRFEEQLDASVYADPAMLDFNVPVFLIQPLVENAIKYGMESSESALRVEVSVTLEKVESGADWLRVEVRNSGHWIAETQNEHDENIMAALVKQNSTGIGLDNLRKRLSQLYADGQTMEIIESGGMVAVIIRIMTRELERK